MKIEKLGLIDYNSAWIRQKELLEEKIAGRVDNTLLLCEHYPVITMGRRPSFDNILSSREKLSEEGIEVYQVERGGDVTFHGPGQLVAYPIFDLKRLKPDVHWYLRKLEETVIEFLKFFGIDAIRRSGYTGVWVGEYKIASIGVAIRRWVTFHGVAVNIGTNLKFFKFINPCGLNWDAMTSLSVITGKRWKVNEVIDQFISVFCNTFGEEGYDDSTVSALAEAQGISK